MFGRLNRKDNGCLAVSPVKEDQLRDEINSSKLGLEVSRQTLTQQKTQSLRLSQQHTVSESTQFLYEIIFQFNKSTKER